MKQFIVAFFNIVAAIVAILTISMIQIEFPNNANTILQSPAFEKSEEFNALTNERFEQMLSLISLCNTFENDDKELNYDIIVAESLDEVNGLKKWTLNECIEAAKSHGLYIDENYNVSILEDTKNLPFQKGYLYNFMFKLYPATLKNGAQSEENFLYEFMKVLSNYYKAKKELDGNSSNFHYIANFIDESNYKTNNYSNTALSTKNLLESPTFLFLSSKDNIISSNIDSFDSKTLRYAKQNNPHPDKEFNIYCAVDTSYPIDDAFKKAYNDYSHLKNRCGMLITTAIVSGILFILTLLLYLVIIFSTQKTVAESNRLVFQIPTEFYIVIYIFLIAVFVFIISKMTETNMLLSNFATTKSNFYILSIYISTILLTTILSIKYSNDTLAPTSLRVNGSEDSDVTNFNSDLLFFGIFIPVLLLVVLSVYLIYLFSVTNDIRLLFTGLFLFAATLCFIIYILYLRNGFNKALNIQVKSNEMRSSLIANVSHDIKTPLTSILNYTQLITDEIENPGEDLNKNLLHYSEVITNKSNRLNELINDLIFDSKVRSGNLDFNMQKLDLNSFLTQVIAEFEDRLNEKGLKSIYSCKTKSSFIKADSTQLYRVFQNLYSNIYKYALENSRIYVDLESIKSRLTVTIKNIQKEKLEVDINTLTERFVRGNKSRTTEGFGLGLSIAESLVTSMGGKLDITNSRDQFIVKITFLSYEE